LPLSIYNCNKTDGRTAKGTPNAINIAAGAVAM